MALLTCILNCYRCLYKQLRKKKLKVVKSYFLCLFCDTYITFCNRTAFLQCLLNITMITKDSTYIKNKLQTCAVTYFHDITNITRRSKRQLYIPHQETSSYVKDWCSFYFGKKWTTWCTNRKWIISLVNFIHARRRFWLVTLTVTLA